MSSQLVGRFHPHSKFLQKFRFIEFNDNSFDIYSVNHFVVKWNARGEVNLGCQINIISASWLKFCSNKWVDSKGVSLFMINIKSNANPQECKADMTKSWFITCYWCLNWNAILELYKCNCNGQRMMAKFLLWYILSVHNRDNKV